MSDKGSKLSKKALEKSKDLAASLCKQLFEHKNELDYDFLVTIARINTILSSYGYSALKKLAINDDPASRLELLLQEYSVNITRIVKEKRVKRYMQSTRVRKKLDYLSNNSYRIVRNLQILADAAPDAKKKDKKEKKKDDKYKVDLVAIQDEGGKHFWTTYFPGEDVMVPWSEFEDKLSVYMPSAKDDEDGLDNLRYILDNSMTGEVTLNKFNEFLKGFSPLNQSLDKVTSLLNKAWFHGFLTSDESGQLLAEQQAGCFLVRFSKSKNGSFALAYVDKDKTICHSLIQRTPTGFCIHENNASSVEKPRVFDKLEKLVDHYSFLLKKPFDWAVSRETWFHGDLTKDEAFELLQDKEDGSYLVRLSSKKGWLTISYMLNKTCQHTNIEPAEGGFLCNGQKYKSVDLIIEGNKSSFKLPVETLVLGKNAKKSKKSKKKTASPLAGDSNYASLPEPDKSSPKAGVSGVSNYGAIPAAPENHQEETFAPVASAPVNSRVMTAEPGTRSLAHSTSRAGVTSSPKPAAAGGVSMEGNYGTIPDGVLRSDSINSSGSFSSASSQTSMSSSQSSIGTNRSSTNQLYGAFTLPPADGSGAAALPRAQTQPLRRVDTGFVAQGSPSSSPNLGGSGNYGILPGSARPANAVSSPAAATPPSGSGAHSTLANGIELQNRSIQTSKASSSPVNRTASTPLGMTTNTLFRPKQEEDTASFLPTPPPSQGSQGQGPLGVGTNALFRPSGSGDAEPLGVSTNTLFRPPAEEGGSFAPLGTITPARPVRPPSSEGFAFPPTATKAAEQPIEPSVPLPGSPLYVETRPAGTFGPKKKVSRDKKTINPWGEVYNYNVEGLEMVEAIKLPGPTEEDNSPVDQAAELRRLQEEDDALAANGAFTNQPYTNPNAPVATQPVQTAQPISVTATAPAPVVNFPTPPVSSDAGVSKPTPPPGAAKRELPRTNSSALRTEAPPSNYGSLPPPNAGSLLSTATNREHRNSNPSPASPAAGPPGGLLGGANNYGSLPPPNSSPSSTQRKSGGGLGVTTGGSSHGSPAPSGGLLTQTPPGGMYGAIPSGPPALPSNGLQRTNSMVATSPPAGGQNYGSLPPAGSSPSLMRANTASSLKDKKKK